MDENLSRRYVQLNQSGQRSSSERDHDAPRDSYQLVYLGLLLAGIGFLLPYNSFIIACDYFKAKYPLSNIVFDMSLVYILVAFGTVCVNNALVETLAFSRRIAFGYLVSFLTLFFVLVFEVIWDVFSKDISYTVNLVAVAIVAFGCTVQQSSFYGYTSMLPARYTQAVMTGESAAGLLVSGNRILTKFLLQNERLNTALFFLISTGLVLACVFIYSRLQNCAFVAYYLQQCSRHGHERGSLTGQNHGCLSAFSGSDAESDHLQGSVRSELLRQDSEDVNLVDTLDEGVIGVAGSSSRGGNAGGHGVLSFRSPPASPAGALETMTGTDAELQQCFGYPDSLIDQSDPQQIEEELANYGLAANQIRWLSNNALSLEEGRHRFKVQDVVVKIRGTASTKPRQYWAGIKRGAVARRAVAKSIWPYMLSISLAYCVTLCLFPGIISEIISCRLHSWMPVILMQIFNAADFLGKMLASLVYSLEKSALVYLSLARVVLVPLLALCALPGPRTSALDDVWAMFLSLALGLSNGVLGSVPMIVAPSKVPHHHKELTGNMMTLSYSVGLTTGSLIAYLIQHWLDSQNQGFYRGSCDDTKANHTMLTHATMATALSATLLPVATNIFPTFLPKFSSTTTIPSAVNSPTAKIIATTVMNILQNSTSSPTTATATATSAVITTTQREFIKSTGTRITTQFIGATVATNYLNKSIARVADIAANMTDANMTTTTAPETLYNTLL
ncbi:equilibrative nucleoside transporter 4-like [Varroa destructor]|uniref:Equilibrative nucleoside transporter 4 n=2 Tax=Arthropoda TaxID=6656 RepID=A0A7M7JIQ4_VARDE|nr:equilibrative nucleoside transporter 4-like [Varroa destructor]